MRRVLSERARARRYRAASALAVIGVVGSGCAGATASRRPRGAVAASTDPAHATPPGTALDWTPRWRDVESPAVVEVDHGTRRVVAGTVRAELRGGRTDVAPDALAERIIQATRVAHGWVFVGRGGLVASSDTFLGPLRRVGQLRLPDRYPSVPDPGRGRFACADRSGAIVTSDGSGPPTAPRQPPPVPARWVVFADADHGFAASNDGRLFASRDGGATFTPVDSPDAVDGYEWTGDGLALRTTGGLLLVGADGALGPMPAARRSYRSIDDLPWDDRVALNEAIDGVFPGRLLDPAAVLADGSVVRVRGRDLVTYDLATGVARSRTSGVLPDECRAASWGVTFALACHDSMLRMRDARTFEALPHDSYVLSDDGRHAVHDGPCTPGAVASADHRQLCVLLDGERATRAIEVPRGAELLHSASGRHFLVREVASGTYEWRTSLVDVDTGTLSPVQLAPSVAARGLRISGAWLRRDDVLVATLRRSDRDSESNPTAVGVGHAGAPLDLVALPPDAARADFMDRMHGVAAGRDYQHVWQTDDGGRTWHPLALPIDGALEAPDEPLEVNCTMASCAVGEHVVVRGWGPHRAATTRVIASDPSARLATRGDGDDDDDDHERFYPERASTLSCVAARRATGAGPGALREHGAHDLDRERWAPIPGALTRLTRHPGNAPLDVEWTGVDARGVFEGHAVLPSNAEPARYERVIGATRTGVFMLREPARGPGVLYFARAGGTLAPRPDAAPVVRALSWSRDDWAPFAARDGGYVALGAGTVEGADMFSLARFAADGALTFHRGVLRDDRDDVLFGLARRDGVEGAVLTDRDDAAQLLWLVASPDAALAPFARRTEPRLGMCTAPTPRDAVAITSTSHALPEVSLGDDLPVQMLAVSAEIEATDDGLCVRRLRAGLEFDETVRGNPVTRPALLELTAGAHGAVTGWLASAEGRRSVRCPPATDR